MRIRILYHDHCFDGAASAAFFSRFMEGAFHPGAEFAYTGMAHKALQIFEPELFDGDENAIVDFKYSSDPHLTWWFDHHQSAFLTPEDAEHFRQDHSGKKMYDPSFKSCTMFIRTVAQQKWGFVAPDLDQLVYWANIIDGAQYPDAKTAVELGAPAMKLTLVIEGSKGSGMVQRIIGWMRHRIARRNRGRTRRAETIRGPLQAPHGFRRDDSQPRPDGQWCYLFRPYRLRSRRLQ